VIVFAEGWLIVPRTFDAVPEKSLLDESGPESGNKEVKWPRGLHVYRAGCKRD